MLRLCRGEGGGSTLCTMRAVVLSGDSHVARFTRPRLRALEALLPATTVYNCAAGGLDSRDLARQAPLLARLEPSAVVMSVGTSDAAPWKQVALDEFWTNLRSALLAFSAPVVFISPPPVDEAAQPDPRQRRTNATLKRYERAARNVCSAVGAAFLDSRALLECAPRSVHEEGGVHLNDEGYAVLIPAIAAGLRAVRP